MVGFFIQLRNKSICIFPGESTENNEAKSSTQENEPEAGEVPDAPRLLHRTLSVFFRHLPMQTTKDDLENVRNSFLSSSSHSSLRLVMQTIFRFSPCLHY